MSRGKLTPEIAKKYESFLGHEMTVSELHLVPYVEYCVTNQTPIDKAKVSEEEIEILKEWTRKGFAVCYPFNVEVKVSREFWDFITDVLFDAYAIKLYKGGGGTYE